MAAINRRLQLRQVAAETKAVLPSILSSIPSLDASLSTIQSLDDVKPLDSKDCPGFTLADDDSEAGTKGTRIRVYDQDTFDTALRLQPRTTVSATASQNLETAEDTTFKPLKPVAVLNLASEKHAGGGWENGALAQEEALCFRSSLYLSLHESYYPLPPLSTIYSPNVLIIRSNMSSGHTLLTPFVATSDIPMTSVISVAGLRHPDVTSDGKYKKDSDREITKSKIRCVLRVAAGQGHRKLVLGALGCGVFGNPPGEVANCFLEVFREAEFSGGWWDDVTFAVLDNAKGADAGKEGMGNYGVLYRALDGQIV